MTLNDLFPISTILRIFDMRNAAEFNGTERYRPAKLYGLQVIPVHTMIGFLRTELRVLALLYDYFATLEAVPNDLDVRLALYERLRLELERGVPVQPGAYYQRFIDEVASAELYPDIPLTQYLTATQVAAHYSVSRASVYLWGEDDPRINTVEYAGIRLWYLPIEEGQV